MRHETLALAGRAGYNGRVMAFDEWIGRRVGRRSPCADVESAAILLATIGRLKPGGVCPRGVFRFRTFEDADRCALSQIARSPGPQTGP